MYLPKLFDDICEWFCNCRPLSVTELIYTPDQILKIVTVLSIELNLLFFLHTSGLIAASPVYSQCDCECSQFKWRSYRQIKRG